MAVITIDTGCQDSLGEALALGITTIECLAAYLGGTIVEDCLLLPDTPIQADAGSCPLSYPLELGHLEAAKRYARYHRTTLPPDEYVAVKTYRVGLGRDGEAYCVDLQSHTIPLT